MILPEINPIAAYPLPVVAIIPEPVADTPTIETPRFERPLPLPTESKIHCVACSKYFTVKSSLDRLVALLIAVVAIPFMAVIALVVLLVDGRPIFYRQTRVGKHGKNFRIWKFRTMNQNAEAATGAVWSSGDRDPRVTPLGRWLRCSHLDELPQLFNVLRGEMDLIGPRPERPEFVLELSRELPHYLQRLAVRPGISGLAQLRLGYDHSLAHVQQKVEMDLEYIATATFGLDLQLMLSTVPYVFRQVWGKVGAEKSARIANAEASTRKLFLALREEVQDSPARAPHYFMFQNSPHTSSNMLSEK
jgi:lipopolysaccharide/colanic/teichoic acid biosynthesis glycosyltransferase